MKKDPNSEASIQNRIRGEINLSGVAILWRNNTGKVPGTWLAYGLAIGSADLIGLRNDGKFVSIEVKTKKGKLSPEQTAWMLKVQSFGGIAGVARTVDEAFKIIREGR